MREDLLIVELALRTVPSNELKSSVLLVATDFVRPPDQSGRATKGGDRVRTYSLSRESNYKTVVQCRRLHGAQF
jgi:hypothetical protein